MGRHRRALGIGHDQKGAGARIDLGAPIRLAPMPSDACVFGSRLGLTRIVGNLVDNACKWARSEVMVGVAYTPPPDEERPGTITVVIDDDGPGIPEDRYEEAFKPFSRLDESRNQNEKGVGLGLAIARDMARGLGGDLVLSRSALGGLRALIRLPG